MENTVNNNTNNQRPTVSKTNFKLQATENGLTRPQLAKYFGIKESQVNNIAKQLGIKLRRNIQPSVILID